MRKKLIENLPAPWITKNMEDFVVIAREPEKGILTLYVVETAAQEVQVRICVTKIVEVIKRYQFSDDVPKLTDSDPGIEQMEVISINDMFNILKVIEINENAFCQIHPYQEKMNKLTPQDCIKWIRSLNVTANGEDVMR